MQIGHHQALRLATPRRCAGSGRKLIAIIETSLGKITCEIYADKAPVAVANFVGLATGMKPWRDPTTDRVDRDKPFYDGLSFHRVIAEFMIQGGNPLGVGTGGPGYSSDDEIWEGAHAGPGVIAMANAGTRAGRGTNERQPVLHHGR